MKLSSHLASLALTRLAQSLHWLKETLSGWVPQQQPVLIPIRIAAERRTSQSDRRQPGWHG